VSGGGVSSWVRGAAQNGTDGDVETWYGTVTSTGSSSLSATFSGATGGYDLSAVEFTAAGVNASTVWDLEGSGVNYHTAGGTTTNYPSLTTTAAAQLYFGFADDSGTGAAGSTSGFSYITTTQSDVITYDTGTAYNTAYAPTATQSGTTTYYLTTGILLSAFVSQSNIANSTSVQVANFNVQAATSGSVAGVLAANASGSGDILDLLNGSGATVSKFGSTGSVSLQNSTNSTTAFQIQDTASTTIFSADTSKDIINTADLQVGSAGNVSGSYRIFSDGFESGGLAPWDSDSGTVTWTGAIARSGNNSLQLGSGAYIQKTLIGNSGYSTVYARTYFDATTIANPTELMDLGTAAIGSGTHLQIYIGASGDICWRAFTGISAGCTTTAPSASTWHKIEVELVINNSSAGVLQIWLDNTNIKNTTGLSTGTTNTDNFALGDTTASTATIYFDDASVDSGTQTGNSSSIYVADNLHTAGSASFGDGVVIGTGVAGKTNPALLVLASGSSSSDPSSETDGAMYYDSSMKSFRCGQNGTWVACDGLTYSVTSSSAAVTFATSGTATDLGHYTVPANDCQTGATYLINAGGHLSAANSADLFRFYLYQNGTTHALAQTGGEGPQATGTTYWSLSAQVTCSSTTTVITNGSVLIGSNANVAPLGGIGFLNSTADTWSTSSTSFGVMGNWVNGNDTSGDTLTLDSLTIQRVGP
jgi:hypothetical protein